MKITRLKELLSRKSSQKFIPEIDALRFFAIIPVMFAHMSQAFLEYNVNFDRALIESESLLREICFRGNIGVELFFGISGFILTLPFINLKRSELKFKKYFLRRLIRIEPPYIIALILFFVVHIVMGSESIGFLWERFLSSFFYLHNLVHESYSYILPPAWSLELEIQFYLLMPLFLYLFKAFKFKYWRPIVYAILLVVALNLNVSPHLELSDYFKYFLAGIVAADVYKNIKLPKHIIWDVVFTAGLLLFFFYFEDWFLRTLTLFLILIASLHLVLLRQMVTNKWVTIIGGMCYSLYLLHFPFYHLVMKLFTNKLTIFSTYEMNFMFQALIFIPLSIVCITAFYLLVEKPFMVLSQRYGKSKVPKKVE
ncbi:acyltransferase family protein [Aggregatimonas sangjinii]|nr:acyltransferase [Aggregatimonas sangjinii]